MLNFEGYDDTQENIVGTEFFVLKITQIKGIQVFRRP